MAVKSVDGLSASLEDYLEAIYHIQSTHRVARAKEIAEALKVSRGSVTGALKSLAEKGLVDYSPYSYVTLKAEGEAIAREIIRRHGILKQFFTELLQLAPETAEANACRVEHAVDPETIDRLVCFLEFLKACPRSGDSWLASFTTYCHEGIDRKRCAQCLSELKATRNPSEQEGTPQI
ncbi:MAG: metal-dependent transcriptional regulator [Deltaproteobacteria bacterium]|nr:metal-dependent transcriptional regulator [Deltaproteobacteria bacterium]